MKKTSVNSSRLSSSSRIVSLACSAAVILAVLGSMTPLASTLSVAMRSALNDPAPASAVLAQSQTSTFYLHGTGPVNNPPTLFLNTTAPTATNEKYKDSAAISRNNGNPWKEIGAWPAAAAMTTGTLTSLSDLHVWLGLKNSDDQGTFFDLRVEAYKNSTLMTSGQSLCITGITRNANSAKEVALNFDPFSATAFNSTSDVLSLRVLTRVGTNANGSSCGGHSNAVGLRMYFDAVSRLSRFSATQGGDTTPPVLSVSQPVENLITAAAQTTVAGTFSDESPTTITVNGIAASIQGSSFTASVALSEGPNTLLIEATDGASNRTEVTRHVARDTAAPVIAIQQPADGVITSNTQVTVSGTYGDANLVSITINGVIAALSGGTFTANVTLNEGPNSLNVVAADPAGNQSTSSVAVTRDTIAPLLTIAQPGEGAVVTQSGLTIIGTFGDPNKATITINNDLSNRPKTSGDQYTAFLSLTEGTNTFTLQGFDKAGNHTDVVRTVVYHIDHTPPQLTVAEPAQNSVAKVLTVRGTVTSINPLVSVSANGHPLSINPDGIFAGALNLPEGVNEIQIQAVDANANSTTIVRTVTIDTTAPAISGLSPAAGTMINATSVSIQGSISDATTVSASVNGVAAAVGAGGLFIAENVPINEGQTEFLIAATDAAGNTSRSTLLLVGKDNTAPPAPEIFDVITPTRLDFQTVEGRAEAGAQVVITGGPQPVTVNAAFGTGLFAAPVNLATGVNVLTLTAQDSSGNVSPSVQVSITSNPGMGLPPAGQPAQINISTGNAQRGLIDNELPRPLIAIVTDQSGAPLAGVLVHFAVKQGGGRFVGGSDALDATTDVHGQASVRYISGSQPGFQLVRANYAGNASTPATFTAEALQAVTSGVTSVSGVVEDQNLRGLPNVLVRISGQQTRTGADGRFFIANVPTGPHQLLELIGRDQITLPGRWPNISFDFDVLPGVNNDLVRPLFLPRVNDGVAMPLDANNVVTQDTTFDLPVVGNEPPVRVTARAGTHILFPPDVTDKRLSVTRIPNNRVPMTLEDGRATSLYISVQPSGAIFETPLEISFPNLDRLPANSQVLLMSFDHDAGRYVQVGTGHVTQDGRSVKSDPGSGIRVGAWHGVPPPPPQPEVTVLGHIQFSGNSAFEGRLVRVKEAWVEGQPAQRMTSGSSVPRWDYRATLSVAPGTTRQAKMEASVVSSALEIETEPLVPPAEPAAAQPLAANK